MNYSFPTEIFDQAVFKSVLACVCSVGSWLVGGVSASLVAMIVLYFVDFVLGFARAYINSEINAARFRRGLLKLVLYAAAVIISHMLDLTADNDFFREHGVIRSLTIFYISAGDFLSAADHLAVLGGEHFLPRGLIRRLRSYRVNLDRKECAE